MQNLPSSTSSNKQSLALGLAVKEKLKTGEVIVQRQAINGLYQEICNPQTPPSMANDIIQLLLSYVRDRKSNRTVATCSLDVLVKICTQLDTKQHHQIKDISIQNIMDQLIKFAIQIHPSLIPHLTRSIIEIYMGKFTNSSEKKENVKLCMNLTSSVSGGSPLVMLIQNRNECLVEILNQVFTYLTTDGTETNFAKLFRFFSPLFSHVFTNRKLFHEGSHHDEHIDVRSSDSSNTVINGSGTTLKTDTMSSTHIKLKLLGELKSVAVFKISLANSIGSNNENDCKKRASLLKQSYSIVLYLVHFLPAFDVDVNSDVVASCFAPLKTILDLVIDFENLFAQLEEEDTEFYENYLGNMGDEFQQIALIRSMIYRHFMSIYIELNHFKIDVEMYFNYLHDICRDSLEHFVEFMPTICNSLLTSETETEVNSWFKLLRLLINLLTEETNSFVQFLDSLHPKHRTYCFGVCHSSVVISTNLLYCIVLLLHMVTGGSEESKNLASVYVQKIEEFMKDKFTTFNETSELREDETQTDDATFNKLTDLFSLFQRYEIALLSCHYGLMSKLVSANTDGLLKLNTSQCSQWAESLAQLLPRDSQSIDSPTYLCATIGLVLLLSRNQASGDEGLLRVKVVKALETVSSEIIPLKSGILLQPLVFYELPKEQNPKAKLSLMQLLPKLGTRSDVNVTPIVKLLSNMMHNRDLLPIVIRLLTDLWRQNDKFFTKLKGFLFSFSKYISSDSNSQVAQVENYDHLSNFDVETRLAIACSVLEICKARLDKAAELLPLITRICCQENNPTVLCYGLQAMSILCKNRIVDFYTIWYKVIQNNVIVNAQTSSLVRRDMCLFFQCSVEKISHDNLSEHQRKAKEEDEYNLFVDFESLHKHDVRDLMDTLWGYTLDEDELVRISAFETLSQYPLHALLFAVKPETDEDSDEKPQEIGSDVLDQREENIFAMQEIRRGWLLVLCGRMVERLRVETSPKVCEAMSPIIQHIFKAELRKPKNSSIVSKDKKASAQSIGLTSFDKFDSLADFVVKQYEGKKNLQVTSSAVLWQSNLAKAKAPIPETEAFKRLLNELVMDIIVGSSPEDFFSQMILTQGFFSLSREYYYTAVETYKERESQTHFDDAFENVFSTIKSCIDQSTVPSTTGNYVLALAGLCLALPINAHHHVLKIIEIVKKKLGSSMDTHEDIKYACNMVLASASFELHIFSQLTDLCNLLISQLHSMINENSTQDVSSASSAIALGVVAKNLCLSQSDNFEKGRDLLLHISNNLFSLCFKTQKQLFEVEPLKHQNIFKNVEKANLNWKQKTNLLFGICQVTDTLVRIGEVDAANLILDEITKERQVVEKYVANPNSVDPNYVELCLPSLMIVSQIVLSFYHADMMDFNKVITYVDMYDDLLQKLEGKSLTAYLKLYLYCSSGFGTLLFGALCESIRKGEENEESGKAFRRVYVDRFATYLQKYEEDYAVGDSSHYQIGSILFFACMLGADLFSPIAKSKIDDSDVFGLHSAEKRPLSYSTFRSIFFNTVLLPKRSIKKLATSVVDIFRSASTEPKLSIKVRKYASFFLGIFSNLYKTDDGVLENSDRLPVNYLSESGLVVYFVQKLTNMEKEDSSDFIRENCGLSNLLLAEKLPKITWSKVIQHVFRKASASPSDSQSQELQKACIRFFCKDAQGTTSSSNSISAMSSLCESQSFLSLSPLVQMEIAELFPQLIAIFPPSRTCSFIDDLVRLTFKTRQINDKIVFTALSKVSKCEVKSSLLTVRKYLDEEVLETIEICIADMVSKNQSPLFNIRNDRQDSQEFTDPFTLSLSVKIGGKAMSMIEGLCKVIIDNGFSNHRLVGSNSNASVEDNYERLLVNLVLRAQYAKSVDDVSTLRLARQVAVKGSDKIDQPVSNMMSGILSNLSSDILSTHQWISFENKRRFIQDTLDMLSFVFNDLESVYFSSYSTTSNQIPFTLENLNRALLFLSGSSLILGANDIYALFNAQSKFLKGDFVKIDTHSQMKMLIYGLAVSFKNKQFDTSTEQSLMSRMYSVLANFLVTSHSHNNVTEKSTNKQQKEIKGTNVNKNERYESVKRHLESLLFEFVIPLLMHIKMLRDDQHVSLNQIGTLLEHHALRTCSKLQH